MRGLVCEGKIFLKPKALNKHSLLGVTDTVIRWGQVKRACSPPLAFFPPVQLVFLGLLSFYSLTKEIKTPPLHFH